MDEHPSGWGVVVYRGLTRVLSSGFVVVCDSIPFCSFGFGRLTLEKVAHECMIRTLHGVLCSVSMSALLQLLFHFVAGLLQSEPL